jgi:hypothetical protein
MMKNYSHLWIAIIAILMNVESFAQNYTIKAGLNLSSQHYKGIYQYYIDGIHWKPGINFGVTTDIPLTKNLSFETGIAISTKGYKQFLEQGPALDMSDFKRNVNLYYLDLPANLKALFDIGSFGLYGTIGPYAGIGFYGKEKSEYDFRGTPISEIREINWGTDAGNDDYKSFDYGLNAGAGMEMKNLQIGFNYMHGLANISSYTEGGRKVNNRVISISLGYRLGQE